MGISRRKAYLQNKWQLWRWVHHSGGSTAAHDDCDRLRRENVKLWTKFRLWQARRRTRRMARMLKRYGIVTSHQSGPVKVDD